MKKGFTIKITPKFDTNTIYRKTIGQFWMKVQNEVTPMGKAIHHYMLSYINNNCKRAGSTGNLEKAINYDIIHGAGIVGFGIGNMDILNSQASYWFVINYGKKITGEMFIPGGGKYRPVEFVDGKADPSLRGVGHSKATKFVKIDGEGRTPSIVRPMGYIEATRRKLDAYYIALLKRIRHRKEIL
jgi:hypothetical protein